LGGGIGGGISLGGGGSSGGGSGGGDSQSAILDIIKSVLTKQGKIAIDGRTNKLIITDVAEVFPQVENILAELDVKAPQILIEAQIVEVSKSSGFDVGFTWGGENGEMGKFTAGSKELPWSYFTSNPSGGILKWFGKNGEEDSGDPMKLDFSMFSVMFNAMMTNGEGRSLGKPKVITMNNNAAVTGNTTTATGSDEAGGGGVWIQNGTFTMNDNAVVKDNTATSSVKVHGGGVRMIDSDFTMNDNATIKGNRAATTGSVSGENGLGNAEGGGVKMDRGRFTMNNNATVAGNTATSNSNIAEGGGVHTSSGVFTLSGGTVYGDSDHGANPSLANTVTTVNGSTRGAAVYSSGGAVIINNTESTPPEGEGIDATVSVP
jgi:hypothetical protein